MCLFYTFLKNLPDWCTQDQFQSCTNNLNPAMSFTWLIHFDNCVELLTRSSRRWELMNYTNFYWYIKHIWGENEWGLI